METLFSIFSFVHEFLEGGNCFIQFWVSNGYLSVIFTFELCACINCGNFNPHPVHPQLCPISAIRELSDKVV